MRLESLKLKNFRGYKEETIIPFSNMTAFVGKNDAGKSTILEALEIFFNNQAIVCERDDLNINCGTTDIEITCIFSSLPDSITIDSNVPTSLLREHLLNQDGLLEIKKVFSATAAKPKEKIFIVCNHPTVEGGSDLLSLRISELRQRASSLTITVNGTSCSEIRQMIWASFPDLNKNYTELLIDKEDTKKIYGSISKHLPLYALFQSDRQSKEDDKEVTDPMKFAVTQALDELGEEIEAIKSQVKAKVIEAANRTLMKLQEMSPELASELIPDFKSEPKFDSQFKLTFTTEDGISINKKGSGVRRLILLNFFRAEAERRSSENVTNDIIYAIEEPETSQHPNNQEMLIRSFMELANSDHTQIILTTHTPTLAGILPEDSLRFVEKNDDSISVQYGNEEVLEKIVNTLGILPNPIPQNTRALILVEGKADVTFIKHTSEKLKEANYIPNTFEEKRFAILPIWGCGNIKHWQNKKLAEQFNIPWCILLDSDIGTRQEQLRASEIQRLRDEGIKAYATRKREPENYIHLSCLNLENNEINYLDTDDAKLIISQATGTPKDSVLENYWINMTSEQIREVERYSENGVNKYEFTEMFSDFLALV